MEDPHLRLSDAERETLFASLATALAEGRLAVDEYDTRCRQIAAAATRADAAGAFADLPDDPTAQLGSPGEESEAVYTATEIAEQRRRGKRPRAAITALSSIAALAGAIVTGQWVLLLIIPAVIVALYVATIGPRSWSAPSPRSLHKARMKELRRADQLRRQRDRAALAEEQAAARRRRSQQLEELKSTAVDYLHEQATGRSRRRDRD